MPASENTLNHNHKIVRQKKLGIALVEAIVMKLET